MAKRKETVAEQRARRDAEKKAAADRKAKRDAGKTGTVSTDPMIRVQGQMGEGTNVGTMQEIEAARIDAARQEEFRRSQLALAQNLEGQIAGTGPSAALSTLQAATDRNVSQQFALAHSGGGAGAMRNAANQAATLGQASANAATTLRAQEIHDAQALLGGVTEQGRNSDITLATNQATLTQDAAKANQTAVNSGILTQADINKAILASRIAAAATVSAANASAAASRYGTDAQNYRFNMEQQLGLDQNAVTNSNNAINNSNNSTTTRNRNSIDSQGRTNDALNSAGGNAASGAGPGGRNGSPTRSAARSRYAQNISTQFR